MLLKTYIIIVCLQKTMQVSTSLLEKNSQADQWEVPCDKPVDTHSRGNVRKLILTEPFIFARVSCIFDLI